MLNVLTKKSEDKRKKKGFTLVELIIVIAIIAILAAVTLPKFLNVTADANKKADLANAKTIESAITMLIANNKITPGTDLVKDTKIDDATVIANALQKVPKTKAVKGGFFWANISTDGTITIKASSAADAEAVGDTILQSGTGVYKGVED